jgi:hypothetical protein
VGTCRSKTIRKTCKAKVQIIAGIRGKLEQLDLDFNEVMGFNRSRRGGKLPPKYGSPDVNMERPGILPTMNSRLGRREERQGRLSHKR